ncbi:MAG TPA: hypothetical protein PLY70_13365 [Saprospiraceae bacterium]|nr:hypothetical protein [Saprospiraceae bacterium]HPN72094.1 hypothetical protein [Saprospiraceae bacterium]
MGRIDRKYLFGLLLILIFLLICLWQSTADIETIKRNPPDLKPETSYAVLLDAATKQPETYNAHLLQLANIQAFDPSIVSV